jgi:hypothetical protein
MNYVAMSWFVKEGTHDGRKGVGVYLNNMFTDMDLL